MKSFLLVVFALSTSLACGGKVVFEESLPSGVGGASGASSSAPSTGTGDACAGVRAAYEAAYAGAVACDPSLDVNMCSTDNRAPDDCGCPKPANDDPHLVDAAAAAYKAMVAAGCAETAKCPNGCVVVPPGDVFLQCINGVCGQGPG